MLRNPLYANNRRRLGTITAQLSTDNLPVSCTCDGTQEVLMTVERDASQRFQRYQKLGGFAKLETLRSDQQPTLHCAHSIICTRLSLALYYQLRQCTATQATSMRRATTTSLPKGRASFSPRRPLPQLFSVGKLSSSSDRDTCGVINRL